MGVFLKLLVVFVLQCLLAFGIYDLLYTIYEIMYGDIRSDLNWGITLHFSIYFYLVICFLTSIGNMINGRRQCWIIISLYLVFLIYYAQHISDTPYRTGLLLVSSLIGFFVPLLLDKIIFLKKVVGDKFYSYRD